MLHSNPAIRHPREEVHPLPGIPRRLGSAGPRDGPTLICVGGLHGNEPPGVLALQRVLPRLEEDPRGLAGRIVGLAGNRAALAQDKRFLDADLNRIWRPERIECLRSGAEPTAADDRELFELSHVLDQELAESPEARILDLHSTSGDGPAFTTLDDSLANRALAFELPVPHVLGIEEELAGTMVGHLNERGFAAIGFESGRHQDPTSIDRAEAAVWIAMEACGVLERDSRPEVEEARRFLVRESRTRPDVVEVRHRHSCRPEDGFVMVPGYESFQEMQRGEVLAHDSAGPIVAERKAMILMPLYQSQGTDGFFVIHRVNPLWLTVSAWVRRRRMCRLLHWLPGVRRDAEKAGAFRVDRSRARWLALQIFHLLGFRRSGALGPVLLMTRRERF